MPNEPSAIDDVLHNELARVIIQSGSSNLIGNISDKTKIKYKANNPVAKLLRIKLTLLLISSLTLGFGDCIKLQQITRIHR
jgi:hypothetical protein